MTFVGESCFFGDTGFDTAEDDTLVDPAVATVETAEPFDDSTALEEDDGGTDTDADLALFEEGELDFITGFGRTAAAALASSVLAFFIGGLTTPEEDTTALLFSLFTPVLESSSLLTKSSALIFPPLAAVTGIFRFLNSVFFFMKIR